MASLPKILSLGETVTAVKDLQEVSTTGFSSIASSIDNLGKQVKGIGYSIDDMLQVSKERLANEDLDRIKAAETAREEQLSSDELKDAVVEVPEKTKKFTEKQSNIISGVLKAVAGLGVIFADEIGKVVNSLSEGWDSLKESIDNINPFVDTQEDIVDELKEAQQDALQKINEGQAASTADLKETAMSLEKLKRIEEAKKDGKPFDADAISEAVEEEFKNINRTQAEEMIRGQDKGMAAAMDAASVDRLTKAIEEQKKIIAEKDYDGPDFLNTEEDKAKWEKREGDKLKRMQENLARAEAKRQESFSVVSPEEIERIKEADMWLQQMLDNRKKFEKTIAEAEGKTDWYSKNNAESAQKQLDELNKAIAVAEKKYEAPEPVVEKPKTEPLVPPNVAKDISAESRLGFAAPGDEGFTRTAPGFASEQDNVFANMDSVMNESQIKDTVAPAKTISGGNVGSDVNAKSKNAAMMQSGMNASVVNAPNNSQTVNNVQNSTSTVIAPASPARAPYGRGHTYLSPESRIGW